MRILISGGAGFIGSHVAEAALRLGHDVAVLDNFSTGRRDNVPNSVRLYEADLRDRAATRHAVRDFRPDSVSHQAAQASVVVSMRDPTLDAENNIMGSLHLLDACTEYHVARFVFASTGGAMYGEVAEGTLASEDTPPRPVSPYAISKLTVEQMLSVYRSERGLESFVLRYANVFGPRQDPHGEAGVVAIFLARIQAGAPININARTRLGDEGCVRDYVYVEDVARMNLLALEGSLSVGRINVGTGIGTSTRDLSRALITLAGRAVPMADTPPRAGDLGRSVLDPTLCLRALGGAVALKQGLAATVGWYAARGSG